MTTTVKVRTNRHWGSEWQFKVDVADIFQNEEMPFSQKRDEIVARLKALPFYNDEPDEGTPEYEFLEIIEEMGDVGKYGDAGKADEVLEDYFNAVWHALYDWADIDKRLWINTL